MSMTPPPVEYAGGTPGYPRRPSSVTPIAIIGIIFGALGIFCLGCGGVGLMMQMNNPNARIHLTQGQITQQVIFSVVGLALSILLLSASIGALNLAAWSRKSLIVYAVLELIFTAYRCIYALTLGLGQTNNAFQNPALPPNPTTQQVQSAQLIKTYAAGFRIGAIAMTIGMAIIMAAYCIWMLTVMRRQDVIAAFEGEPPTGYPPQYPPQPPQY